MSPHSSIVEGASSQELSLWSRRGQLATQVPAQVPGHGEGYQRHGAVAAAVQFFGTAPHPVRGGANAIGGIVIEVPDGGEGRPGGFDEGRPGMITEQAVTAGRGAW